MIDSRREFLHLIGSAIGTTPAMLGTLALGAASPAMGETTTHNLKQRILSLFDGLPGEIAIKILSPATDRKPEFLLKSNSSKMLFVGSAIKTFILCEALRQADTPNVVQTITKQQVALDASVWTVDSATFNPPYLSGSVSERTALEAMIMHSDNTGTDMSLKLAGPDNVRRFIASAGLKSTLIPDSTRVFFGYLVGAKDYKTFSWDEEQAALNAPIVNPPLNPVETLASSADDLVSYYARALQGEFFQNGETLAEFRRILSLADAVSRVVPLGASGFVKGGSIDVSGFHCLSIPGGMYFDNRWVYFAATINWNAAGETDPSTVGAFALAVTQALALVRDALSVQPLELDQGR
jgi:beta-lactamase class A